MESPRGASCEASPRGVGHGTEPPRKRLGRHSRRQREPVAKAGEDSGREGVGGHRAGDSGREAVAVAVAVAVAEDSEGKEGRAGWGLGAEGQAGSPTPRAWAGRGGGSAAGSWGMHEREVFRLGLKCMREDPGGFVTLMQRYAEEARRGRGAAGAAGTAEAAAAGRVLRGGAPTWASGAPAAEEAWEPPSTREGSRLAVWASGTAEASMARDEGVGGRGASPLRGWVPPNPPSAAAAAAAGAGAIPGPGLASATGWGDAMVWPRAKWETPPEGATTTWDSPRAMATPPAGAGEGATWGSPWGGSAVFSSPERRGSSRLSARAPEFMATTPPTWADTADVGRYEGFSLERERGGGWGGAG